MIDKNDTITVEVALRAMSLFWDDVYQRTGSETVASVLGDLSPLEDGTTADPAALVDFLRCIEENAGHLQLFALAFARVHEITAGICVRVGASARDAGPGGAAGEDVVAR